MTLVGVRDELAERLAALEGLRVYAVAPETAPELPAAIIQPGQPLAEYGRTLGGGDVVYNFRVLALAGSGDDGEAWEEVAAYAAPTGPGSVKAAVEVASGGSKAVDWWRVVRATEGGRINYGRAVYWGLAFEVQAYVGE